MNIYRTMNDIIEKLNKATKLYDEGHPEITDKEWDDLYFELKELEDKSGIHMPNSPTQTIKYDVVSSLSTCVHNHKMLSLDKTKSLEDVKKFIKNNDFSAMCKMDGLTCSLRYVDGELVSAETRGNGLEGENVLHNAKVIETIPKHVEYDKELIVDGEVICTYDNFERFSSEYKNPRNFASGSIRLLDSKICASRNLRFVAWDVIKGFEDSDSLSDNFKSLENLGFEVVPNIYSNAEDTLEYEDAVDALVKIAQKKFYPIDGIVFKFDKISFSRTLGSTGHHFKNALAYKFYDETYTTEVKYIEWSMGKTGQLSPVVVFKPVEIDGTVVERASMHNLTILEQSGLRYVGQLIEVYKANQIIPQVAKVYPYTYEYASLTGMTVPDVCPICGKELSIAKEHNTKVLKCTNPDCNGKLLGKLSHFCSKNGMDIDGLSESTLKKFIELGWVNKFEDIYNLITYSHTMEKLEGFGKKSVIKLLDSIEQSKNTTLDKFICSLSIPLIGKSASKTIADYFNYDWDTFKNSCTTRSDFSMLDNFGQSMCKSINNYLDTNFDNMCSLAEHFKFIKPESNTKTLADKVFVITGSVNKFTNRNEIKTKIESLGGKVTGSVSVNTSYLVNNDINSTSSKNKKAKELGIPIITEDILIEMMKI